MSKLKPYSLILELNAIFNKNNPVLNIDIVNGMMENFFWLLKTEMFYDQEDKYKNIDELILAIDDYIYYYNYDRILSLTVAR